jgi:hypothetical protein
MSTPANVLPQLDLSKSVPLNQTDSTSAALPQLDLSKSVPITDTTGAASEPTFNGPVAQAIGKIGEGTAEGASDLWGMVKAAPAGIWHLLERTAADPTSVVPDVIKHPIDTYHTDLQRALPIVNEYEKARSSGKSIPESLSAANNQARTMGGITGTIAQKINDLQKNPTREGVRDLTDIVGVLAAGYGLGKGVGALLPEEGAAVASTAVAPEAEAAAGTPGWFARNNPFKKPFTSPKDLGTATAQPVATAAVRSAVGAEAEAPILAGSKTVVDEPLADLATKKSAAYKQIDDEVGFDLKAEKQKLSDTQYAIRQPGADVPKLQTEMDASTQRIADANTKLAAAKIDPKVADALNTSWKAGADFRQAIVRSTASDGTIDVNKLLNQSKNLRFTPKRGDRLAQFFGQGDAQAGKAVADNYISELEQAQKTGKMFMDARTLRNNLLKWGLVVTGVEGVAGGLSHFSSGQ